MQAASWTLIGNTVADSEKLYFLLIWIDMNLESSQKVLPFFSPPGSEMQEL